MSRTSTTARRATILASAIAISVGLAAAAHSQSAAPAGPSPARAAIESRKAVFTLIGANFKTIGAVLKGAPYDAAAVQKSVNRLVFLSEFLNEAFPDVSNVGEPETKAKADIWSNRADFDKKLSDFQTHLVALQQVASTEKDASEAFKTAAAAVGQDCKACHDSFKVK